VSAVIIWDAISKKGVSRCSLSIEGSKSTKNTTKRRFSKKIGFRQIETCMETTIFASSKREPHPTVQKSRGGSATQLTGFEFTEFLHLGLHAGIAE
jgi:hypothetical protein